MDSIPMLLVLMTKVATHLTPVRKLFISDQEQLPLPPSAHRDNTLQRFPHIQSNLNTVEIAFNAKQLLYDVLNSPILDAKAFTIGAYPIGRS
jgi:hypothetical protein